MTKKRRKPSVSWPQRVGFVLTSMVAAILILELGVRLIAPQDTIRPMITQLDPELIYSLKPNYDAYLKGTSVRLFHLRTNSLGLREHDIPFEKPSGVFRILLLGDSVSMAEGVELEETYLKQMEVMARARGLHSLETINAAVRGYGNDQQLLLYRRIGKHFNPDLVVLTVYTGNDLDDNWAGKLFRVEAGTLIQQAPTMTTSEKYRFYAIQSRLQRVPGYTWSMSHSHLANMLRVLWTKRLQDVITKDFVRLDDVPIETYPEFELTANILQVWGQEVRDIGARPFVMIIPTREEAQVVAAKSSQEQSRIDLGIERVCRLNKFSALNLTPQIAQWPDAEALWLADGHLSPIGHTWVAERLLDALQSQRLLPDR